MDRGGRRRQAQNELRMDRGGHSREQLDLILGPLLVGEHEQHQVFPGGRGHMRKNLNEIDVWPAVVDEHGEYNVFPDAHQLPVAAPPVEAPANPQPPMAALTADEEHLALLLDLGAVIGLPQQIEREALNSVVRPAIVDAGLVPTMALVDNSTGSGTTLTPTLEFHVAGQTKRM